MNLKNRTTFIYGLVDPIEPDVIRYVGKTNNSVKKRLNEHIKESRDGVTHKNRWIKKIILEGRKPMIFILDEVNMDGWERWEMFYIEKYKSDKLTNATKGGDVGMLDDKYKELSLKKYKRVVQIDFKTKKILNTFLNISDAANYIKAKSRSRISDCCNEKIHTSYGYIWRFLDENNNIIETKKVKKTLGTSVRVAKIDINTNKTIDIYDSITIAAKENNGHIGNISKCCKGKIHSSIEFVWKYVDEYDNIINPKNKKTIKQVAMLDSYGMVLKIFINSSQAAKYVGLKQGDTILKSCRSENYYAAGYRWIFYDND